MYIGAKWQLVVWMAAVVLLAGPARADFMLTGDQHLDVDSAHDYGYLGTEPGGDVTAGETSSATLLSGGSATFLYAYDYTTVEFAGGSSTYTRAYDYSIVNVTGGGPSYLYLFGDSTANVSGGSVYRLQPQGGANQITVNLTGGTISARLYTTEVTTVRIYTDVYTLGEGLSLDGNRILGTGTLTGEWLDGSALSVPIYTNDGTILIVPAPATMSLLGLGLGTLFVKRRRRRMTR
jgi:hypothetical protein